MKLAPNEITGRETAALPSALRRKATCSFSSFAISSAILRIVGVCKGTGRPPERHALTCPSSARSAGLARWSNAGRLRFKVFEAQGEFQDRRIAGCTFFGFFLIEIGRHCWAGRGEQRGRGTNAGDPCHGKQPTRLTESIHGNRTLSNTATATAEVIAVSLG